MPHDSARRIKSPIGPRIKLESFSEISVAVGQREGDTSSTGRLAGYPAELEVYRSQALPAPLQSSRPADGYPGQREQANWCLVVVVAPLEDRRLPAASDRPIQRQGTLS